MKNTNSVSGLEEVPDVIRRYFALDADREIDSIVALFTDDATVVDEGETRRGTTEFSIAGDQISQLAIAP